MSSAARSGKKGGGKKWSVREHVVNGCGGGGAGAWSIDCHFRDAALLQNLPVLLGLTGIWNTSFLGYPALAILPYTQALAKLAPHIQQVPPLAEPPPLGCCGLPQPDVEVPVFPLWVRIG